MPLLAALFKLEQQLHFLSPEKANICVLLDDVRLSERAPVNICGEGTVVLTTNELSCN
jgi:hypothetical protein